MRLECVMAFTTSHGRVHPTPIRSLSTPMQVIYVSIIANCRQQDAACACRIQKLYRKILLKE